jgi:proteasome beta subunit
VTLIVALACRDGLIIASDSQSTAETTGQPTKSPSIKLHSTWDNVAWGAAGSVGLTDRVREELERAFPQRNRLAKSSRPELRKKLVGEVSRAVKDLFANQYLPLNLPGAKPPLNSFLFVGCASDGPIMLEIAPNLVDEDHMRLGYCAIGSGDIYPYYAMASLAHFDVQKRTLLEAKMIAYRIMNDAIRVAAFGIGPPIQMYEIVNCTAETAARTTQLSAEDLQVVEDKVAEWKGVEAETLQEVVGMRTPVALEAESEESASPK